ncbi:MAG TPA: hypothetical protein VL147_11990 [Devosia sp.]|nr:hypothetical protein [Devosia sp.]
MIWVPLAAVLGLVACGVGFALAPEQLVQAWLVACHLLLGLPLGAAAILMLYALTGGRWGQAIAPQLRALVLAMPVAIILFLPLLGVIGQVLPFLSADPQTLPAEVAAKLGYLAPGWIIVRTFGCFVLWIGMAMLVRHGPLSRRIAAVGLVVYVLSLTVFTTDWMVALEPDFVSTIYPLLVANAQLLGALAVATAWHLWTHNNRDEAGGAPDAMLSGDLGKLLLSAILGWAYLAYMQWLIIWIGDLPSEIGWYLRRGGWWQIPLWGTNLCFVILPFMALLLRRVRNDAGMVSMVAVLIGAGYLFEGIWRVAPAFAANGATLVLLPSAMAASGGIATIAVLWRKKKSSNPMVRHA